MTARARWALGAAATAWLAIVVVGQGILIDFATAPGEPGDPPPRWPEGGAVRRDGARPTLVMAAHPLCPCTRASLGELALIMARARGRVAARLLVVIPEDADARWDATGLQRAAGEIPGVDVIVDAGGREARRFGAATSGHTLLYASDGRLLFSGGITGARGHAGDNAGRSAVVALIEGGAPGGARAVVAGARDDAFVFGCGLRVRPSEGGPTEGSR